MSVRILTRRTAMASWRSRALFAELGLFGLLFGLTAMFSGADPPLASMLVPNAYLFVPIIAVALGYRSIARRRENGSLRLLLTHSYSRWEIVLGTALGRCLVIVGTISFGFLIAGGIAYFRGFQPTVGFVQTWIASLLLGVAMTGITVSLSACVRSTVRAAVLSVAVLVLVFSGWSTLAWISSFIDGGAPISIFVWSNPLQAFLAVTGDRSVVVQGVTAFYTSAPFGALVLFGWSILALAVGALRLERTEL